MNRPNVLLVVADQHRFDWIEGHGDLPVRTPNLRRLQACGVTFRRATTPSPLCAPARACLATGLDYDSGPVPNNDHDLPVDAGTYYRSLRDEAGYFVAGVGKFDLHKATMDWGLDGSRLLHEWGLSEGIDNEGKFDSVSSARNGPRGPYMKHLDDRGLAEAHSEDFDRRSPAPYGDTTVSPLPEDCYLDNWIAANAHAVLDHRPADRPWHVVVNFAGPHDPLDVTAPMRDAWAHVDFPPPCDAGPFEGDHTEARRRYAAMVENIDRHVGTFLDRLEAEGELGSTVVIYTSDHGEMLGDHGLWGKQVPFDPSIRIPLVVSGPVVSGRDVVSEALVSLEDLAATILELADLDVPSAMTASSLVGLLRGERTEHRDHLVSGLDRASAGTDVLAGPYGRHPWATSARWRSLTTAIDKLIVTDALERPVLIDLIEDPQETTDVSSSRPTRTAELLEHLHRSWAEKGRG